MYPIKILIYLKFQHQQGQNWFRKSMEINMRQNIITAIVQRAPILNS
jgi:hypothetical protein